MIDLIRPGWRKARFLHALRLHQKLADVKLTSARYDATTRWPVGFDHAKQGARLVR